MADVGYPQNRGADDPGLATHDDVPELLGRVEPSEGGDRDGELSAGGCRLAPDASRRIGRVLRLHGGDDVTDRDAEIRHPAGVEAEEHREIKAAERRRLAHAG